MHHAPARKRAIYAHGGASTDDVVNMNWLKREDETFIARLQTHTRTYREREHHIAANSHRAAPSNLIDSYCEMVFVRFSGLYVYI